MKGGKLTTFEQRKARALGEPGREGIQEEGGGKRGSDKRGRKRNE